MTLFRTVSDPKDSDSSVPATNQRRLVYATIACIILSISVPVIFEKYTFYLYASHNSSFFTFSGLRFWADTLWFLGVGAMTALILGRKERLALLVPFASAALFVIIVYVAPLCEPRECYVSSTDGLTPVRDFLFFGSLCFLTLNAARSKSLPSLNKRWNALYVFVYSTLVGLVLSFFPVTHMFAGVSAPYPFNYLQWFLAWGPPAFLSSIIALQKMYGLAKNVWFPFLCGLSGLSLCVALEAALPCEACSGYILSIASILGLGVLSSVAGIIFGKLSLRKVALAKSRLWSRSTEIVASGIIVLLVLVFLFISLGPTFETSTTDQLSGVANTRFSPFEVGSAFPYAGGYLAIPKNGTSAVGVTVNFGNTSIAETKSNFLAAGVGVQSPNCCKDGIDLAYREDAVMFSNGTAAALARVWWACDNNIVCGGFSWQQLLHIGAAVLPKGTLSSNFDMQMNWTTSTLVSWFYRTHFSNGTIGNWVKYSTFNVPKIQNPYFDVGVLGSGNSPRYLVFFYQFGISSAQAIRGSWHVTISCPSLILDGSWTCVPKANYISGLHSYWKVVYSFGVSYPGVSFSYLGNKTVEFYYSGNSPPDLTSMW